MLGMCDIPLKKIEFLLLYGSRFHSIDLICEKGLPTGWSRHPLVLGHAAPSCGVLLFYKSNWRPTRKCHILTLLEFLGR